MKYTADDIKQLGTILGIWAHPDDESFNMGGVLAAAAHNNQRAACITATRGDAGKTADQTKWPQARLGDIRVKELENALHALGITEHYWLQYQDGMLPQADSRKAVSEIAAIINAVQPDSVFTFCADGITGHNDHRTVHAWTKQALVLSDSRAVMYCAVEVAERYNSDLNRKCDELFNIYFNIDRPSTVAIDDLDIYFELPKDIHDKKVASLQAQESQTAQMFENPLGLAFIDSMTNYEGFMKETV